MHCHWPWPLDLCYYSFNILRPASPPWPRIPHRPSIPSPPAPSAPAATAPARAGPRTEAGKARASRNALTHGLTARVHLLQHREDEPAFQGLTTRLFAELAPTGEVDGFLVANLAAAMWRTGRAHQFEGIACDGPSGLDERRLGLALRYHGSASRELFRSLRALADLRRRPFTAQPPEASATSPPGAIPAVARLAWGGACPPAPPPGCMMLRPVPGRPPASWRHVQHNAFPGAEPVPVDADGVAYALHRRRLGAAGGARAPGFVGSSAAHSTPTRAHPPAADAAPALRHNLTLADLGEPGPCPPHDTQRRNEPRMPLAEPAESDADDRSYETPSATVPGPPTDDPSRWYLMWGLTRPKPDQDTPPDAPETDAPTPPAIAPDEPAPPPDLGPANGLCCESIAATTPDRPTSATDLAAQPDPAPGSCHTRSAAHGARAVIALAPPAGAEPISRHGYLASCDVAADRSGPPDPATVPRHWQPTTCGPAAGHHREGTTPDPAQRADPTGRPTGRPSAAPILPAASHAAMGEADLAEPAAATAPADHAAPAEPTLPSAAAMASPAAPGSAEAHATPSASPLAPAACPATRYRHPQPIPRRVRRPTRPAPAVPDPAAAPPAAAQPAAARPAALDPLATDPLGLAEPAPIAPALAAAVVTSPPVDHGTARVAHDAWARLWNLPIPAAASTGRDRARDAT